MERYRFYKNIFLLSLSALCLAAAFAVVGFVIFEMRWFAKSYILQCDGDRFGTAFALVVDTENETVLFEGRALGEDTVERRVVRFTDTQIGMTWDLDDGKNTQLWISRVNNTMKMWRQLGSGERDETLEEINGRCYVVSAKF